MRMKKLALILYILAFGIVILNGQDSGVISDSIIYITPEDEVLLRDREAKYLIKLGSDAAAEFKLSKAWSLEVELGPDNIILNKPDISFALGTRYYYQMAKRIKEGKQANNFSGHYFSAMLSRGFNFGDPILDPGFDATAMTLGIGTQQRYLQNEYFDFGIFLDFQKYGIRGDPKLRNSFTLRTESIYGFVFGKKHDLNEDKFCPVIKCYQDRRSAFKINRNDFFLLNISQLYNTDTYWFVRMNPKVGYEFKIGNSPFSIDQSIGASFSFSSLYGSVDAIPALDLPSFSSSARTTLTYDIASRYYYRMKKSILSGEQGNNLSGSYIYLRFRHEEEHNRNTKEWTSNGIALFGIGRQTTITGRLFLDAKLAVGPELYGNNSTGRQIDGELEFVIGYMF